MRRPIAVELLWHFRSGADATGVVHDAASAWSRPRCGITSLSVASAILSGWPEDSQCHSDRKVWAVTHRDGRNYKAELDDDLLERITEIVKDCDVIETLSNKRTNWIASFDRAGVWVETERSRARAAGPQLVPAWMIVVAWERLCKNGTLSHIELLHDMKVMRSAFVCALLAQFPDVVVVQDRPAVLERIATS